MSAFKKAWKFLKGNPDARVQVNNDKAGFSARDFAAHPAAIGAANRQSMAAYENRKKVFDFARIQGQEIPRDRLNEVAHQMVTPEQRARMKNTSFDLAYKNPNFISRTQSKTDAPRTESEEREQRRAMQAARARRYERGRSNDGRALHNASNKEQRRAARHFRQKKGEE